MRTVTLQSILLRAWQRAGNDGSDVANLGTDTRAMLLAAVNERIEQCWSWTDWPDLCRTEARTVQGAAATGLYLDYAQSGQTAMGEVFAVTRDNPATHAAPREILFRCENDKVLLPVDAPATVYVRYRLVPTVYTVGDLTATVPGVIGGAVGLMLTADLLEEDGQLDKAQLMAVKAENELVREQDKFVFQQNQTRAFGARVG